MSGGFCALTKTLATLLPIALAEPLGQQFQVQTPTGRHHGVTVPKPFIDPGKQIPKQ